MKCRGNSTKQCKGSAARLREESVGRTLTSRAEGQLKAAGLQEEAGVCGSEEVRKPLVEGVGEGEMALMTVSSSGSGCGAGLETQDGSEALAAEGQRWLGLGQSLRGQAEVDEGLSVSGSHILSPSLAPAPRPQQAVDGIRCP